MIGQEPNEGGGHPAPAGELAVLGQPGERREAEMQIARPFVPESLGGGTTSAVCSVSVDPLLVLVRINNRSETLRDILESRTFTINMLATHWPRCRRSSPHAPRRPTSSPRWPYRLDNGHAVLDYALVSVSCELYDTTPGGDHTIVVGSDTSIRVGAGEPLVRHAGRYRRLGPEAA